MLVILTSHPIQYQAPLWRALAEDGRVPFEVWFLTDHAVMPSFDREFRKAFAWDQDLLRGYPHRFLPVRPNWRMNRFLGIRVTTPWRTLLKESKATHLWVEGWRFWENWAAMIAARHAGIKVFLRGETNDLRTRQGIREFIRRVALGRLFKFANYFLCIGSANRRFYESFGIPKDRLLDAPYCVDNDWFKNESIKTRPLRTAIREKWKIPTQSFCVLFCGKFISKKRPVDVARAVSLLSKQNRVENIHLLYVGTGELENEVRMHCRVVFDAENLKNHTESLASDNLPNASFVGFLNQNDIVSAYIAADLLVLPSDAGETWGLVVNEAMACGLPAVVSDRCGCSEDIVKRICVESTYHMGSIHSLAAAIERHARNRVSEETVREIIDSFSVCHTIDAVVEQITQGGGA